MTETTLRRGEFDCNCGLHLSVTTEHAAGTNKPVPSSYVLCPGCGKDYLVPGWIRNFSKRLENGDWETIEGEGESR